MRLDTIRIAAASASGMPELPGLWSLTPLGALVGLLVYLGLAIVRGWLIPKSTHELVLAAANKRGDEWKETTLDTRKLNDALVAQNAALVEATKTPAEFFGTVMREGGGVDVGKATAPVS